jgi:chromosomal replication initiator protein
MNGSECNFENFVVDRRNKFAYEAAKAVANAPVAIYNPLFLYGKRYDGRTHLLRAIENRLKDNDPQLHVIYVRAEEFDNDFLYAMAINCSSFRLRQLRDKYRTADVLIVDDINCLMGKGQVIQELICIFDYLYLHGKQIVLSSDRPPAELSEMDDMFRKKLEMGLVVGMRG